MHYVLSSLAVTSFHREFGLQPRDLALKFCHPATQARGISHHVGK